MKAKCLHKIKINREKISFEFVEENESWKKSCALSISRFCVVNSMEKLGLYALSLKSLKECQYKKMMVLGIQLKNHSIEQT